MPKFQDENKRGHGIYWVYISEKMTPPIESVEDLANQNKILYGVVKGGSTAAFFEV